MAQEPVVIPEKIYFKIGEVCELVGVQAHVLRYWETEFSVLSPQKNKSGQRSYRRRDVEIALRIKQLLYNEMFTIAGAIKKLQTEQRQGSKAKAPVKPVAKPISFVNAEAPMLFDAGFDTKEVKSVPMVPEMQSALSVNGEQQDVLRLVTTQLIELREMLKSTPV